MGGRGSCYLNFYDNSKSTSGDIDLFDILEGAEEDKDTEKEFFEWEKESRPADT